MSEYITLEERSVNFNNMIVCFLEYRGGREKAVPSSIQFEDQYEDYWAKVNHLNELDLPGKPALFWINKGYDVYSFLTDDNWWIQYCVSNFSKNEKYLHIQEYEEKFIEEAEPEMCLNTDCYAYLTFDDCEHQ